MQALAEKMLLFCVGEGSYSQMVPGAALVLLGLLVLASGILLARSASRRASADDLHDTSPPSTYILIILLIIAGCFIMTFGVAFSVTFILEC